MDDKQFRELCRTFCDHDLILRTELLRRGVAVMPGRSLVEFLAPLTTAADSVPQKMPGKNEAAKAAAAEFRRVKTELDRLTVPGRPKSAKKAAPAKPVPAKKK